MSTDSIDTDNDPGDGPTPATGRTTWLRWAILVAAGAGVAAMFLWWPDNNGAAGAPKPRGAKPTPVTKAPIERGAFVARTTYPGELDADTADVAANITGRLVSVQVRIGERVTRGQELARVDASDLARQRAETVAQKDTATASENRASVELRAAQRELERTRSLFSRGLISQQQLDDQIARVESLEAGVQVTAAQRAQAQARVQLLDQRLTDSRVRAPFDGVVTRRYQDAGSFVSTGTAVVRLVARTPLRVRFDVPEREVAEFETDADFAVRAPPTGDREISGRVTGVAAEVDRERRIVRVEGVVEQSPDSWLPGMYAEVVTVQRTLPDATIVPAAALVSRLQPSGKVETGVFQPAGDTARWILVRAVAREGSRAAIEPISEGEGTLDRDGDVLVSGHTDLSDGGPILLVGGSQPEARAETTP